MIEAVDLPDGVIAVTIKNSARKRGETRVEVTEYLPLRDAQRFAEELVERCGVASIRERRINGVHE